MTTARSTAVWNICGRLRTLAARTAVLGAFLIALPLWGHWLRVKLGEVRDGASRSLDEQLRDEWGPGFMGAVEGIRKAVPADGSYLLVADPYGPGAASSIALRMAALPRKAILFRRWKELQGQPVLHPVATVVVERDEDPPRVVPGAGLLEKFDPAPLGAENRDIPAAVDEATVDSNRRIRVRGWCQERGGTPCDVAAVVIAGHSVPMTRVVREPRPDVQAVLPWIGPCPKAGYRFEIPPEVVPEGPVDLEVVFRTPGQRWRVYPPKTARKLE